MPKMLKPLIGKPCRYCQNLTDERGRCRECCKIKKREWRQNNREESRLRDKIWYWNNVTKARIRRHSISIEKRHEYYKRNYKNHYETYIRNNFKRRSILKTLGVYTKQEWDQLCEYFGHVCVCCYETKPLTRDHVVPLSKGGTNTIENLQPLCKSCNSRKNDKTMNYKHWFMVA